MVKGKHYKQTYSPVTTLVATKGWKTRQLDFMQAYTPALIEKPLYMEIPKGIELADGAKKSTYVLKLKRNVYGQKQAGQVWYQHLQWKLVEEVGFMPSDADKCVFFQGKSMYVLYMDDSIFAGPDDDKLQWNHQRLLHNFKKVSLDITIEGDIQDFLGINIDWKDDDTIHMSQPHLINQILKDLWFKENTKAKPMPAKLSTILSWHNDSKPFDWSFNYKSIIGKLSYLDKGTCSNIAYITHQCTQFSADPKTEHGDAIQWIARYLHRRDIWERNDLSTRSNTGSWGVCRHQLRR